MMIPYATEQSAFCSRSDTGTSFWMQLVWPADSVSYLCVGVGG